MYERLLRNRISAERQSSAGRKSLPHFRRLFEMGVLRYEEAARLRRTFDRGWPDLVRTRITERLILHASELAWAHGLRGYDAVHLASAAAWQQALGRNVTVASFDKALWAAAREISLDAFPGDLPALLATIRKRQINRR